MKLLNTLSHWWHEFFRKRRISLRHATDGREEWHVHLSPAGFVAALVASALFFFVVILTLTAYTPLLELLPGYRTEGARTREALIRDIARIDSMERVMEDMMTYNEHITLIMEGRTPVVPVPVPSEDDRLDKTLVPPSREDSLLRARVERALLADSLAGGPAARRSVRETIEMLAPAEGALTARFDIGAGRLGVRIAAKKDDRVIAAAGGTVVLSLWSPEQGHVVQIQHPDNLLSVYLGLGHVSVETSQTVRSGEVIGYTASGPEEGGLEFQLWNDGKPVDPEGYILF